MLIISNLNISNNGSKVNIKNESEIDSKNNGLTIDYHITDWYINENYYLKETSGDGISPSTFAFEQCDSKCLTCEDGVDGTNCIECSENFVFYEDGGKKCESREINVGGDNIKYYYNDELNELRKCHISCNTCKDGIVNNNCSDCNSGYVFIDDIIKGRCVLEAIFTSTLKNYYKEQVPIEGTATVDV